ncbi:DUF885 domain-containing protein [Erythrobacteraceae bacterium CFH 75059]|uniref:DUF885 domain-containing protein n=1 Tax=Qipengyuania thermophila TaxID=2509361 RepID=UPI00101FD609|nr:DUF885 domain-containing protein [Qipengyuania thermophila]TCD02309.1 DUF885 domain-containing protein [Erythrobacteraceae bacterium CFH 75059]
MVPCPSLTRRQALLGLASTAALALPGCVTGQPGHALATATDPGALLDSVAFNLLRHEPARATGAGVDTGEHAYLRGRLGDTSLSGQAAYAEQLRRDLARVQAVPRAGLAADMITNLEVVESGYATALAGFALPYGDVAVGGWRNAPYAVIQNVGSYLDLPRFMDADQPLASAEDAEHYLARILAVPRVLDGELERIRHARGLGVIPPAFLLDKAIAQMTATAEQASQGAFLARAFRERLTRASLPLAHADRAEEAVRGPVLAALLRQLEELRQERRQASDAPGMYARPHGEEWYGWALRASTTTTLGPEAVHRQGLEELEALHARMDPILRRIGYTTGSIGARMQALSRDPRYQFPAGDPGRAEIMAVIEDRIGWIRAQMPRAFRTLVDPRVEVRRLPLSEEPGAPAAYGGAGSKDGSIPARMWINLRTTDLHRRYDLPDLVFHETLPGHVWEGEYSNRLPLIRSILAFNAFSEGWALYGEQLADELGAYDAFEVGRLGYLQALAFRACRMVVDTGLHAKGWSRAQAVNFFVERNGSKREEVESEVDRYCSWPAQACGYKLGHSQIVAMRDRAQEQLGSAFDLRDFNDAIVLGGNAPLDVMARNVDRYIARARRR